MAVSARGRDELIVQGAEFMAQLIGIVRPLLAELPALPLDVVTLRARTAVQVAVMGVTVGQCLSWLTDERQDEMVGGMMALLGSMRVLLRGSELQREILVLPPHWELLRWDIDTYRQRVVEEVWAEAGVLPFRHARR